MTDMTRKPVQLTVAAGTNDDTGDTLFALCNDGTIWALYVDDRVDARWRRVQDIPQTDEPPSR